MSNLLTAVALTLTGTLAVAAVRPLVLQEPQMPGPTDEHRFVHERVGSWTGTVTLFVPGMPETPVPATETVRAAGPFWVLSEFRSEFMGAPYVGHGQHGYDPRKGKYVSTWIDEVSSFLSVMEGTYDEETRTIESHWEAPNIQGEMAPHRSVQELKDDAYTLTFYTGGEKTMVIEMKRKGAKPVGSGSDR